VIAFYKERGSTVSVVREIVIVQIHSASQIDSPAYDLGLTEDQVREQWQRYYQALHAGKRPSVSGE